MARSLSEPIPSEETHQQSSGTAKPRATGKVRVWSILRLAVSALLIGYVVWRTDWSEVLGVLRQTDPWFMLLSFMIGPVLVGVSCWKWSMLLRAFDIRVPFVRLFILYQIGGFFSNILPSNVGGDVIRATTLARSTARPGESVSSVFIERYTGLAALVVMAVLSVPLNLDLSRDPRVLGAVALATGGYLVLLLLVVSPSYITWLQRLPLPSVARKPLTKIQGFQSAVRDYRHHRGVLAKAFLISILWNVVAVMNVYLSARAFGGDVSFARLMVTVPLILTITMVPISLGGIGLGEWAYMFAFTQIGAGASLGLSVAIFLRIKGILWGGLGATFFTLGFGGMKSAIERQPPPVGSLIDAPVIAAKSD